MEQVREQRRQTVLEQALEMVQRLRAILWDRDFEFSELLSGLLAMAWGAWLLNPTFSTYDASPTFAALAFVTWHQEWLAGGISFLVGCLQLLMLLRDQRRQRKWLAAAALLGWGWLWVTFVIANWRSTGTVVYPAFILSNLWAWLRLTFRRVRDFDR